MLIIEDLKCTVVCDDGHLPQRGAVSDLRLAEEA